MQERDAGFLTFYRVTRSNPPALWDFLSNIAKRRRPPRTDPHTLRIWAGKSVFDGEEAAREQARRLPAIGSFIATLQIREGSQVHFEQTGYDPHHFTLWADPGYLLNHLTSVVPV